MNFYNGKIFDVKTLGYIEGGFSVEDGKFTKVCSCISEGEDLKGKKIIPGLIDIHGHGNSGYDFSTCNLDGLKAMAKYLASNGITSFAATNMTAPFDALKDAYQNALYIHKNREENEARVLGINMEGPFFSYNKRGAQNPEFLAKPDVNIFNELNSSCEDLIKIVCVAPDTEGALDFISEASKVCTVSVAHTEADYDLTLKAFEAGATHMTHLFNGMVGIHHRNPGPVLAAHDTKKVYVELICDGVHINPAVIRAAFKLFEGRVVIISDSLACCGLEDGNYDMGGLNVNLKGLKATLDDGTLAGSVTNLYKMMKNAISFGIDEGEAIKSCTINPATQLGCADKVGSIEEGKAADFIVCDDDLNIEAVYIAGKKNLY